MPNQDEIYEQQELLVTHRRTLASYLKQRAIHGITNVQPFVIYSIYEAREAISRIKTTLREWGVDVEDHPDDFVSAVDYSQQGSLDTAKKELAYKEALMKEYKKRYRVLELQAAMFGKLYVPAHIQVEINDLSEQIRFLEDDILLFQDVYKLYNNEEPLVKQPSFNDLLHLRQLRVFLCHSSSDKPKIKNLYRKLQLNGVKPWLDEKDILPGQDWKLEIPKAVRRSDVVIVCLSHEAISKLGYIHTEIEYAIDIAEKQPEGTICLIPLRLQPCEVPVRLKRWQWVDYFKDRKKSYSKLLLSLKLRADQLGLGIKLD
jgi:hypothetical protein